MKNLIALNFAIGALLMVGMIAFQKYEGVGLLAGVFLLPGFFALALVNTAAIFSL